MSIRLQNRDGWIFEAIYSLGDGLFPRSLIKELWWRDAKDDRAMHQRLLKLEKSKFIWRPTQIQYREWCIPEPVIFLDWRGIFWLAQKRGIQVEPPGNPKQKKQLDKFASQLKKQGLFWRRQPPSSPKHELKATQVRVSFGRSAAATSHYTIQEQIPESYFRHNPDTVQFSIRKGSNVVESKKRQVIPDDYMLIRDERLRAKGQPSAISALVEVDLRTHNNPRLREKLAAYAAYLGSRAYLARFLTTSGRWFFITTGEVRMTNLMKETEQVAGNRARFFYFSIFQLVETRNVFADPIWWQPGAGGPQLLENTM